MPTMRDIVEDLLDGVAAARGLHSTAELHDVLFSSLDQMRLLVGLEDRFDVTLEVEVGNLFDLSSRQALYLSIERLLSPHTTAV